MIKINCIVLFLGIYFLPITGMQRACGQDLDQARQHYSSGNDAYKEGRYAEALAQYCSIPAEFQTFAYYYNVANAYYKLDSIPQAILHYERARRLKPDDENIKVNLELANGRIQDRIKALPTLGVRDFWSNLTSRDNLDAWTYVALGFLYAAALCFGVYLFFRGLLPGRLLVFAGSITLLFACLSFAVTRSIVNAEHQREAVVFESKVDVKSVPGSSGTTLFILHEGTKVQMKGEDSGWVEIRIADGNVGWIPSNAIVVI
jgi:tetratricopeptide (TPR) repeat protein